MILPLSRMLFPRSNLSMRIQTDLDKYTARSITVVESAINSILQSDKEQVQEKRDNKLEQRIDRFSG